jgi:molybdenum cofactor cytidylyltransferase
LAPHNKLLARGVDDVPLISRTLSGLSGAGLRDLVVVVGHQHRAVAAAIGAAPVRLTLCSDYGEGLSHSLRTGLLALGSGADAVIVCLGDMPLIDAALIDAMIATWSPGTIVIPHHAGRRGNPVLWDRVFVPDMLALRGDSGARALFRTYADRTRTLDWATDAVLRDADTPEALRSLPGGPWHAPDGTLI